ncbi:ATP-binding cassette domain-containing protein [Vagococcus salmoninarum]|uniref:ATP-binding cassette domain-containing protein n=1 Tax=Vagococcus salmoninarum TaxID=2739 RepID=UPI000F886C97|nr:ATP-binding cassette domain-containing protein [Vagococcus salmoninarum]
MLKLTAIKKSFPIADNLTEDILKGLDLQIKAGSFTVIYGPSGCGKTTLLNLISGLDWDYSGDILYRHQKLADLTKEELTNFRKENIGFVFQHFNLIAHMSVF